MIDGYLSKTSDWNHTIEICPYALSDFVGSSYFSGESSTTCRLLDNDNAAVQEKVNVITIDEFVKQNNISKINFIKSDIEGAERDMLRGAYFVLKTMGPVLSICTYHLADDREVIKQIILEANPDYIIHQGKMKLYAYVP